MYDDEIEPQNPPRPPEKDDSWKQPLRQELERWMESADALAEEDAESLEEESAPDLYSMYEELTALRTENRKANRKAADVFSQLEAEIGRLREQLAAGSAAQSGERELPRSHCLALVEMLDRFRRLAAGIGRPPKPAKFDPFGVAKPWEAAWGQLKQGFSILLTHYETLVESTGVQRIETLGAPFDPITMAAVSSEPANGRPANIVAEEISPGYRWRGELLRPAEVKITKATE